MKRILLAEDDEIMQITVYDRLVRENWQVDVAVNGLMAVALLEQNQYHLVLSDIRMPGTEWPGSACSSSPPITAAGCVHDDRVRLG